jgi:hypothetical protein
MLAPLRAALRRSELGAARQCDIGVRRPLARMERGADGRGQRRGGDPGEREAAVAGQRAAGCGQGRWSRRRARTGRGLVSSPRGSSSNLGWRRSVQNVANLSFSSGFSPSEDQVARDRFHRVSFSRHPVASIPHARSVKREDCNVETTLSAKSIYKPGHLKTSSTCLTRRNDARPLRPRAA